VGGAVLVVVVVVVVLVLLVVVLVVVVVGWSGCQPELANQNADSIPPADFLATSKPASCNETVFEKSFPRRGSAREKGGT
jgi:hypothetical protein